MWMHLPPGMFSANSPVLRLPIWPLVVCSPSSATHSKEESFLRDGTWPSSSTFWNLAKKKGVGEAASNNSYLST